MNGHAHEFAPPGAPPAAICPGIEVLVHRRATELIADRPRRRVATLSSVGGVAIAAICAVLVLVIGSPSGSGGLLSPRQAVAAVVESLDGDGILHWVREGDLIESPDQADRPGTVAVEEWTDLATGELHAITTRTPSGGQPQTRLTWRTTDADWVALPAGTSDGPTIRQTPRQEGQAGMRSAVDAVRAVLQRAEQGSAEIAAGGEDAGGRPLVVVTERRDQDVRRVWITRDGEPEVVRSEDTVVSRNAPQPIVTTTTTKSWQILPRTPEALADVEIPTNAKRIP